MLHPGRSPLRGFNCPAVLLQIAHPKVDKDALVRFGAIAPNFSGRNAHGVKVLWIFAETVGVSVWKNVCAVMVRDDAMLTARISREASMSMRIEIPRHNSIANAEARFLANLARDGRACFQDTDDALSDGGVLAARNRQIRIDCQLLDLCFDFITGQGARFDDRALHRGEPTFIVARS